MMLKFGARLHPMAARMYDSSPSWSKSLWLNLTLRMLVMRAKNIDIMKLNVRICLVIPIGVLNVSPMSIKRSPDNMSGIDVVAPDSISVAKIR
jgi:hypothetical protein